MGYVVVIFTIICLIIFIFRKLLQLFGNRKTQQRLQIGYYLLVDTYEKQTDHTEYYGVFQQGERELTLQIPFKVYLKAKPPQRGKLVREAEQVIDFQI